MVAWYWLILAFCVGIAFATITDEWCEWENTLTDVLAWIALIIGFVPLALFLLIPVKVSGGTLSISSTLFLC